jgi:predicted dehydrogenase
MKMGVIGYGRRIRNMLAEIRKVDPDCRIVAITDVRNDEIRAAVPSMKDVAFYEDYRLMLTDHKLDGLLIGTRCSIHATIAADVLPYGIPLFLEKPVATRMADLIRLKSVADSTNTQVVVSFPLRTAPIVQLAKEIVNSGRIGTVEHVQAVNNVPYGGVYYHHWYRDENETGGLFLQKATHDFDYIQYLLGERKPVRICAVTSKQIFKGNKPAGLKCRDCDERDTCPESMYRVDRAAHDTGRGILLLCCGYGQRRFGQCNHPV